MTNELSPHPLTMNAGTETMEEGEGGSIDESIDIYYSLLKAAEVYLRTLQSDIGKIQVDIQKFRARMDDWITFQEDECLSTPGQSQNSKSGPKQKLLPLTPTRGSTRSGPLAGATGKSRNAANGGQKGKKGGKNET